MLRGLVVVGMVGMVVEQEKEVEEQEGGRGMAIMGMGKEVEERERELMIDCEWRIFLLYPRRLSYLLGGIS